MRSKMRVRVRHLKEGRGDKEGGHENDRQLVCERERMKRGRETWRMREWERYVKRPTKRDERKRKKKCGREN